jgi:hypothetical protein
MIGMNELIPYLQILPAFHSNPVSVPGMNATLKWNIGFLLFRTKYKTKHTKRRIISIDQSIIS